MTIIFGDWSGVELVELFLESKWTSLLPHGGIIDLECGGAIIVETHFRVLFIVFGGRIVLHRTVLRALGRIDAQILTSITHGLHDFTANRFGFGSKSTQFQGGIRITINNWRSMEGTAS